MRAPAKAGKGRKGGRERRERWRQTASPGKSSILSENHRKRGFRATLYKKEVIFTKK